MNMDQKLRHRPRRLSLSATLALAALALAAFALVAAFSPAYAVSPTIATSTITQHTGMAEASAAAMLDPQHFVVAEDECNTLLTYRIGEPAPVGQPLNLAEFLGTKGKASDIEAAARVGDVIYWISSHSLPKSGKPREWRQRFFATRVDSSSTPPTLTTVGKAYKNLLADLAKAKPFKALKLDEAATNPAESEDGFNIEGLAEWKNGGVLIGLRAPLREGRKAVLLPLENPAEVVNGKKPRFGAPMLQDLNGRGVRSIERVGDAYVIVAGPVADTGSFALYRWSGNAPEAAVLQPTSLPDDFAAEAMLGLPGGTDLLLLSDDGSRNAAADCGSPGKASQTFRALRLNLP